MKQSIINSKRKITNYLHCISAPGRIVPSSDVTSSDDLSNSSATTDASDDTELDCGTTTLEAPEPTLTLAESELVERTMRDEASLSSSKRSPNESNCSGTLSTR